MFESQNNLDLSSNQYGLLREIAEGDNMFFGPAVYTARVMVGMENIGNTARIGYFPDKQIDDLERKIKVFPNPTSGLIEVESTIHLSNGIIEVYTLTGQKVGAYSLDGKTSSVDLSKFNQGIYFYRVLENNTIIDMGKIIINK